jgi:hypothetical protein
MQKSHMIFHGTIRPGLTRRVACPVAQRDEHRGTRNQHAHAQRVLAHAERVRRELAERGLGYAP